MQQRKWRNYYGDMNACIDFLSKICNLSPVLRKYSKRRLHLGAKGLKQRKENNSEDVGVCRTKCDQKQTE